MSTQIWNNLVSQFIHSDCETENTAVATSHPKDLISFQLLCKNEKSKSKISSEKKVIYLDSVAKKEYPNANPSTMDFMHVIIKRNIATSKGKKIILAECRFDYDNVFNIKASDLENKIRGSKTLLEDDISLVLDKNIFLFNDKVINQAINYLARLKPNGSWIAVTAKEYEQLLN